MTTVRTLATVAEAVSERGHVLGGGTLLMREVNYRPETVTEILRITDASLKEIRIEMSRITLGAGVTMAAVAARAELAALAPSARSVGGPAIRNMATVGGNLFAPHPYGDFAAALLALDARVHWAGGREEEIESFLAGRDRASGLVTAVSFVPPARGGFRFRKVSRTKPKGVSLMSIAANLTLSGSRVERARIAFGAMGPTPLRAKAAETALEGKTLDEAGIARALTVATDGLAPPDDALASSWYRDRVAPVHLSRLLLERS
ncbi:FAD binding domain-containing protein [Roseobacter sinensis]|uniref:FAD binding domain-containing protein n=1 Tax=Roseobacter sinensis TaxID=2931391 RepID=A0ABT3BIM4_9RHOB|nr:FAD binding domain-containing protein [Roseobacter sp. WL0113]MCV3273417.1 FAD binding domain-containing protein [Roseobacter sp. WL0113]